MIYSLWRSRQSLSLPDEVIKLHAYSACDQSSHWYKHTSKRLSFVVRLRHVCQPVENTSGQVLYWYLLCNNIYQYSMRFKVKTALCEVYQIFIYGPKSLVEPEKSYLKVTKITCLLSYWMHGLILYAPNSDNQMKYFKLTCFYLVLSLACDCSRRCWRQQISRPLEFDECHSTVQHDSGPQERIHLLFRCVLSAHTAEDLCVHSVQLCEPQRRLRLTHRSVLPLDRGFVWQTRTWLPPWKQNTNPQATGCQISGQCKYYHIKALLLVLQLPRGLIISSIGTTSYGKWRDFRGSCLTRRYFLFRCAT